MKVYWLQGDKKRNYASFSHLGTWSGVTIDVDCDLCGQERHTFRREGIVIDRTAWRGEKMFRVAQFGRSKATLVSEAAREELLDQGFSNLAFFEAGEIK